MRKTLRQKITGYEMPMYMVSILSEHYCPYFLQMTIIREGGAYMFNYESDEYRRIELKSLKKWQKLEILKTIIELVENIENHLIPEKAYMIEPELIYAKNNSTASGRIRLLFYPDMCGEDAALKIEKLVVKLFDGETEEDGVMIDRIRGGLSKGDFSETIKLLEKGIAIMKGERR